jgi:hypothetical protein
VAFTDGEDVGALAGGAFFLDGRAYFDFFDAHEGWAKYGGGLTAEFLPMIEPGSARAIGSAGGFDSQFHFVFSSLENYIQFKAKVNRWLSRTAAVWLNEVG